MRRTRAAGVVFALATCSILLTASDIRAQKPSSATPEFRPRRVVRAFPAIVTPKSVPADQAGDSVTDNELVLGVVVNDQPRAYPINMLTGPRREIINDELGEQSIAATW